MFEDHRIVQVRGEPLPAGCVGVRVRARLSGCPSRRWSRALSARLANDLSGHKAVGHLRLDEIVEANQIVLDGVETSEAPALAGTLRRAVEASNQTSAERQDSPANVPQDQADEIAHQIELGCPPAMTSARPANQARERDHTVPNGWFG